jgi:TolB-like protein/Tfp pilus assembly protein PilF
MVRRDGLVKVLDFGLAKLNEPDDSEVDMEAQTKIHAKTQAGLIMGTVAYMSPEQARGKVTDLRTDIWSFGCVLYEMLTGRQPFHAETMTDVLANIIHKEPSSIITYRRETPAELERIITKMLNKDIVGRFGSTKELLNDLKQLQTQMLVDAELARTQEGVSVTQIQPPFSLNTIAVLPFADISTVEDNQYFSDGLTEEIIMNLSKLQMLKVVPSGSTIRYVKKGRSYKQAASDLGIQYLLEGSVRRNGNDLRITAQLIDTSGGAYLWAETYRGTMEDIFEIQEKVAVEIVRALRVRLSPDEELILKKRFTENTEAYQLYLRGRFFWNKRSEDTLWTAIKYFEEAIGKDERYALAWAGIADSYSLLGEYGKIPRKQLYPKARAAVYRALEIDDNLAEGHTSLAILLMLSDWDWLNSEKEFKLALELNPNYATAHHWYSQWFLSKGRMEESLRMILRAAELDPVSQAIFKDLGLTLYYSRRFDEAIEMASKTLELDPNYAAAHRLLSLSYQGKEMFDEAIAENRNWGALTGNDVETSIALAQLYAAAGQREDAEKLVELVEKDKLQSDHLYRGLALVFTALGENDVAFEWLEKSFKNRDESILNIKVDPKVDRLRSDRRFDELIRKLGLEE